MMKFDHTNPNCLVDVLQDAIRAFNDGPDKRLLLDEKADDGNSYGSVGECAIAHRLAVHLEDELRKRGCPNKNAPIAVDCEYNRHRGGIKQQLVKDKLRARVEFLKDRQLKEHPEREGWYVFSVFPDIIVHERGKDEKNLIAVEIKRASNNPDDELDCIKLHLFTIPDPLYGYQYRIGATVIAFDEGDKRHLEIGRLIAEGQGHYRAPFLDNSPLQLDFLPDEQGFLLFQ
jgi:hypothetical protein